MTAGKIANDIVDKTHLLNDEPEAGPPILDLSGEKTGFRYLIQDPYILVYFINDGRPTLIRIFHYRQNYLEKLL